MDRFQSRMLRGTVRALLAGIAPLSIGPVVLAQAPGASNPAASANRGTQAPGTWTIAVVTSTSDASSRALLQSLRSNPWVVANSDRVKLAEINNDAVGRQATTGSAPVLVYQQGLRGPEMMGGRSGFSGGEDVEAPVRDPNLTQANLFGKGMPTASAQAEIPSTPTAQTPAPMVSAPQAGQSYLPPPQTTTTYAMPVTASVVNAPQQHILVNQPPTQVIFAQAPGPMVYVPQPATAMAPTQNLFMGMASAPVAGVTAPPMMPVVSQPVASVASAPLAMANGPAVAGAALTTSSVSVPVSSSSSRIRVRGPGPMASALARLGERMTTLGRTRIESVQETRLETQTSQTPSGQYMTLSSTAASPILSQPSASAGLPPLPPCPTPAGPQASPQAGYSRRN